VCVFLEDDFISFFIKSYFFIIYFVERLIVLKKFIYNLLKLPFYFCPTFNNILSKIIGKKFPIIFSNRSKIYLEKTLKLNKCLFFCFLKL
jgi:hypothetical protein